MAGQDWKPSQAAVAKKIVLDNTRCCVHNKAWLTNIVEDLCFSILFPIENGE